MPSKAIKNAKVTNVLQEHMSRGQNPFEDGYCDCFYDGIENHVLTECQELAGLGPERYARSSEGVEASITEDQIKEVLQASNSENKSTATAHRVADLQKMNEKLDPTQMAMPKLMERRTTQHKPLRCISTGLAGA